jgi:hypothetical protein
MLQKMQELMDVILHSHEPSILFSKIAITAIILFWCVRHLLTANLVYAVKKIDREIDKAVHRHYFRSAWLGWLIFAVALGLTEMSFFNVGFGKFFGVRLWIAILLILFLSAIYCHLYALTRAVIRVLKQKVDAEKQ